MDSVILSVSYAIPIILAVTAGIMALIDAARAPKHKRVIRLFQGCIAWYFVIVYALAWSASTGFLIDDDLLFILRSGLASRFGIALLWVWIIADIKASCHRCPKSSSTS